MKIFKLDNMIAYFTAIWGKIIWFFFKHFYFFTLLKETIYTILLSIKAKDIKCYLYKNIFLYLYKIFFWFKATKIPNTSKNSILYKLREICLKLLWQLYF